MMSPRPTEPWKKLGRSWMRQVGNEHDRNLIKNPLATGFMRGSWRAGKSAGLMAALRFAQASKNQLF